MNSDEIDNGDNEEIMELIRGRLAIGIGRYGHGVRAEEDTRHFGTQKDTWVEMALEEVLDNLIYITAEIIRIQRRAERIRTPAVEDEPDTKGQAD